MKSTIDIIKKMLVKELSPSERLQLSKTKRMEAMLQEQWDENLDKPVSDKVDHKEMWHNITAVCWGMDNRKRIRRNSSYWKIGYSVAAVAMVLLIGFWVAKSISDSYIVIKAPKADKLTYVLPDGSTIWLNAGSEIQYQKDFAEDRKLKLTGEAFFDVVKMNGNPFEVYFQEACVEVKGTEFNIKSDTGMAEITLFSGKVIFSAEGVKQKFEMNPSERIVYEKTTGKVAVTEIDLQEYDWRSTEYRFQNKPLGELINFMNRIYKVNILVKDADSKEALFTGSIRKTETLSDVLTKVCISFELRQERKGQNIILY